jgi:RNA polymerase subunit RPABC4/transcription elongation factor Spt4
MPWFCGFCSRWNLAGHRVCPYCGRAARGRLCRRCKEAVPKDAGFCPSCGSDNVTEPGARKIWLTGWQRRTLAAGWLLIGWLLLRAAMPWLVRLALGAVHLLCHLLEVAVAFWLLTALLPPPCGRRLRRIAGWLLRFFVRFLAQLVR